ncbi:hypothetical protein AB0I22_19535 [Streptomyces sp. NPDC050610]|uniref:hypothetical protein n=1 Tax=Streptomyces sp. NPDC050610 TaxID=3157097 RepID=UPI003424CC4C
MSLHTMFIALLCGLVLLMLTAGSAYVCWQHPSATAPVTVGATVAGVFIAAGGVAVAAARRREN